MISRAPWPRLETMAPPEHASRILSPLVVYSHTPSPRSMFGYAKSRKRGKMLVWSAATGLVLIGLALPPRRESGRRAATSPAWPPRRGDAFRRAGSRGRHLLPRARAGTRAPTLP